MEEKLFYAYLKYQKDGRKNAWANLLKLHWPILMLFAVSLASTIATLVVSLIPTLNLWSWVGVAIMVIGYTALTYTAESFQIKRSHEKFAEYCDYCAELLHWLACFSIDSKEKITSIKDRILAKISDIATSYEKSTSGMDKWVQGFAIPIVLTIVTTIIAGTDAAEDKAAMISVIVLVFFLVWYLCNIGAKMLNFNKKRKLEQLECFASDLQGILDTQFEGGIAFREVSSQKDAESLIS